MTSQISTNKISGDTYPQNIPSKYTLLIVQMHTVVFVFKEVDYLISQETGQNTTNEEETEIGEATCGAATLQQEILGEYDRPNSVHVQTLPVEYFGRSQGTQTKGNNNTKTMVTKGTQTCITNDLLSKYLSMPKMVSTGSQTDPVNIIVDNDDNENRDETEEGNKNTRNINIVEDSFLEESASESDGEKSFDEESCSEDYSMTSGDESEIEPCAK